MQYTENLQLAKYDANDVTSYLEVSNANLTKIDAGHGALNTQVNTNTSVIGSLQEDVNNMAPQVADANTKANAGLSNTASVYDATQTYAKDDFTLYNNNLYKCNTPVTQAESFDGTKWTRVKTTDEIKASKEEITQIKADMSLTHKLENKYAVITTDVNGNCDITNLFSYIKPENFISLICDDSGATYDASAYIYMTHLYVHVKGMFDGQSKPNSQVSISINYAMPI